jgi:hypothetical protein
VKKYKEDRGDDYLKQVAHNLMRGLWGIEKHMTEGDAMGLRTYRIEFQTPLHTGRDYRGIIRGVTEEGRKFVAFCNGETLNDVVLAAERVVSEGDRWRDDVPYDPEKRAEAR